MRNSPDKVNCFHRVHIEQTQARILAHEGKLVIDDNNGFVCSRKIPLQIMNCNGQTITCVSPNTDCPDMDTSKQNWQEESDLKHVL